MKKSVLLAVALVALQSAAFAWPWSKPVQAKCVWCNRHNPHGYTPTFTRTATPSPSPSLTPTPTMTPTPGPDLATAN